MKFFAFNENSILNNAVARTANAIILFLLIAFAISNESELPTLSKWSLIFIIVFPSFVIPFSLERTVKLTRFFEYDTRERQKKKDFISGYLLIVSPLCIALGITLALSYEAYFDKYYNQFYFVISLLPIPILIFNILNIPSLFYPALEDSLKLGAIEQEFNKNESN